MFAFSNLVKVRTGYSRRFILKVYNIFRKNQEKSHLFFDFLGLDI